MTFICSRATPESLVVSVARRGRWEKNMKIIEYMDPTELMSEDGVDVKVRRIPSDLEAGLSDRAIELWKFSKRRITAPDGNLLMRYADTMTSAFAAKIEEFLSDPEHINAKFGGKRPTDEAVAARAGFSRAKWNRLTAAVHLDIERGNAFAVAIALKLNEVQTEQLLYSAGFALNYELELDSAIMYFIKNEIYDIDVIFETLSEFSDVRNGLDKFTFLPKK